MLVENVHNDVGRRPKIYAGESRIRGGRILGIVRVTNSWHSNSDRRRVYEFVVRRIMGGVGSTNSLYRELLEALVLRISSDENYGSH